MGKHGAILEFRSVSPFFGEPLAICFVLIPLSLQSRFLPGSGISLIFLWIVFFGAVLGGAVYSLGSLGPVRVFEIEGGRLKVSIRHARLVFFWGRYRESLAPLSFFLFKTIAHLCENKSILINIFICIVLD